MMANIMCVDCGVVVEESSDLTCCPNCGSKGVPALAEFLDIKITWQELRIICMWASNWAMEKCPECSQSTVHSIIERIGAQHAERAEKSPLTMLGELGQIRDAGFKFDTNIPGADSLED